MTQKEVIRKLIDLTKEEMATFDFKVNLKAQGFSRTHDKAIFFYFFLVYDRTNIRTGEKGFLIEPHADINIPRIEEYYKQVTINKVIKHDYQFITLGNRIANILANPDGISRKRNESLDLFVFEEKNLQYVAFELMKYFKEVALPYFLRNNTVAKVDELFNTHPKEYSVHMMNDLWRFIKGLIAAKLNANPESDKLLSIYTQLILERDMPDFCMEEMGKLKSIWPLIGKE